MSNNIYVTTAGATLPNVVATDGVTTYATVALYSAAVETTATDTIYRPNISSSGSSASGLYLEVAPSLYVSL
jgi:hypothetical protein